MKSPMQVTVAALIVVIGNGCVSFKHKRPPEAWPKPISANAISQFDGAYYHQGIDPKTGKRGGLGTPLFEFVAGRSSTAAARGVQVKIHALQEGNTLQVQLFDEQGVEVDSTTLRRGEEFDFSRGFLALYGRSSGWKGESGNLGTGVEKQKSRLYLSSTHDLLGKWSTGGFGLFGYFIPVAGTASGWLLWSKLDF